MRETTPKYTPCPPRLRPVPLFGIAKAQRILDELILHYLQRPTEHPPVSERHRTRFAPHQQQQGASP